MTNYEPALDRALEDLQEIMSENFALKAEVERLKGIVDEQKLRIAGLENDLPLQYAEDKNNSLIKIINGMFPMWMAAMSYCEHGKNSDLMRMRNYYNGRDNPLTFDELQTIFRLRELFVIAHDNKKSKNDRHTQPGKR
jgi:hypothetical protein